MRKKILINESQLNKVINLLKETEQVEILTKNITDDLLTNYEPALATYNNGVEYTRKNIVTKKVDGDKLSTGALLDYLTSKYPNITEKFIAQVITDWYNGVLDGKNYILSKSVRFM